MTSTQAALLDTDAFSALYVSPEKTARRQGHPVEQWRRALASRRVVIAFQTRAEILVGARNATWGEHRMRDLAQRLDATPTVYPDPDVMGAFIDPTADAKRLGIADKHHTADRWVAACAIAKGLQLLARDAIFANAPSGELLPFPRSHDD